MYLVILVSMGMASLTISSSSSSITSVLAAEALLLDSMMTVDAALPSLSSRSAATATSDASTSMGRVAARSRATSCFSSTISSTGSLTFPRADFLVEVWLAASGELMLLFFELFANRVVGDETLGELKLFLLELLVALSGFGGL